MNNQDSIMPLRLLLYKRISTKFQRALTWEGIRPMGWLLGKYKIESYVKLTKKFGNWPIK